MAGSSFSRRGMRGQGEHEMFFSHTILFLLPTFSLPRESRESTPDGMGLAGAAWLSAHHPWVSRKYLLKGAEHHPSTAAFQLLPWGIGDRSRWQAEGGSPEPTISLDLSLLLYEMEPQIPILTVVMGSQGSHSCGHIVSTSYSCSTR